MIGTLRSIDRWGHCGRLGHSTALEGRWPFLSCRCSIPAARSPDSRKLNRKPDALLAAGVAPSLSLFSILFLSILSFSSSRAGSYSDDLVASGVAHDAGVPALFPPSALLPAPLGPGWGWGRYWRYVRRQVGLVCLISFSSFPLQVLLAGAAGARLGLGPLLALRAAAGRSC